MNAGHEPALARAIKKLPSNVAEVADMHDHAQSCTIMHDHAQGGGGGGWIQTLYVGGMHVTLIVAFHVIEIQNCASELELLASAPLLTFAICHCPFHHHPPSTPEMPSQKTFRTKVKLAKAQRQNRYVPQNFISESLKQHGRVGDRDSSMWDQLYPRQPQPLDPALFCAHHPRQSLPACLQHALSTRGKEMQSPDPSANQQFGL